MLIVPDFTEGLRYTIPGEQSDILMLTLRRIVAGFNPPNWQDAWQDHLDYGGGIDNAPDFYFGDDLLRLNGRYIRPQDTDFTMRFHSRLRTWLYNNYLSGISHFYEFGCGSGLNLPAFARMYPGVPMTGLDFAPAAVQMAEQMGAEGRLFNMYAPPPLTLMPGSGVLTMASMEQLGSNFAPFLAYLLRQKIKRVVHVEPLVELYDSASPFDGLAIDYHRARGYLTGFLPAMQELERDGELRILLTKRTGFGSRYHEAFSILVWEPIYV